VREVDGPFALQMLADQTLIQSGFRRQFRLRQTVAFHVPGQHLERTAQRDWVRSVELLNQPCDHFEHSTQRVLGFSSGFFEQFVEQGCELIVMCFVLDGFQNSTERVLKFVPVFDRV
jgi:hypothetical protein